MRKLIPLILFIISLDSKALVPTDSSSYEEIVNLEQILDQAEGEAPPEGRAILETSREMIRQGQVIRGNCWDYINGVFDEAGYGRKQRTVPFKSKFKGPFADSAKIEGGDWLYFINHSFHDIEHSAIFVAWTDRKHKEALMVSYAGGNQEKPARYKKYKLDNVYNIIRAH